MGCTGSPADSHDIRWYTIHKDKLLRCGECGSGESPFCVFNPLGVVFNDVLLSPFCSLQVGLPRSGRGRGARSPSLNGAGQTWGVCYPSLPFLVCLSRRVLFFCAMSLSLLICIEPCDVRDEKKLLRSFFYLVEYPSALRFSRSVSLAF